MTNAAVRAATREGNKLVVDSQRRNHGILRAAFTHTVSEGLLEQNPIGDLEATSSRYSSPGRPAVRGQPRAGPEFTDDGTSHETRRKAKQSAKRQIEEAHRAL